MEKVASNSSRAHQSSPIHNELMKEVRSSFHYADTCPYIGERIYFESAGGSLTLKSVVERTSKLIAIPDNEHRINTASLAMSNVVEKGVEDLKVFFGAKSGVVFGGETGSECLFRLIRSAVLAAPKGGSVLSSAVEHPSTYSATQIWAENSAKEWIEVPFNKQSGVVSAQDYAAFVRPDTHVATVIHTNPVTGVVMDVKAIVAAIKSVAPKCFVIIDGIQHAPHGYLDVESYGADAYVISLYKVYSKFNNGYAWVSDRMSTIPHDRLIGKPDNVWELGSRDPSALAAITEVVRYLAWLGDKFTQETGIREKLWAAGNVMLEHEHVLISLLLNGTDTHQGLNHIKGITVVGTQDLKQREGAVAFSVENYEATDLVAALGEKNIRVHARLSDLYSGNILRPLGLKSVVRVSFAHYNTVNEVEFFLGQLLEILEK